MPLQILTFEPTVLPLLAVCAIAAVALSTGTSVVRNLANRKQAKLLARALEELESIKRLHDDERRVLDARLTRIEHALDTLAVEMERVGEGQRYVTRLLAPRSAEGQSSAGER